MSREQMQQYRASMHNNHMQQAKQMSLVNGQSPAEMSYSPQAAPTQQGVQTQQGIPHPASSPFPMQQQAPHAMAQQAQQTQQSSHQHQLQQQQQQHAMQQHHQRQQLQQQQHQQQLQLQQQQQAQQQQLDLQHQHQQSQGQHQPQGPAVAHNQPQNQPNGVPQHQQPGPAVFKSPLPNSAQHQQHGTSDSPQVHDFAYNGNSQPGQPQHHMQEEYSNSPQAMQQQQPQQQVHQHHKQDSNGMHQQGNDQQGRQIQMPSRQFSQHQAETGPMPPPQAPTGRRNAMAPPPNGQQMPRAPTPASAAATPTANGMQQGSPDAQHLPLTPHTPRTPNAQALSSGASAPGSGNSTKAVGPTSAKTRKRTNTDTSAKEKKVCFASYSSRNSENLPDLPFSQPRMSKAKEKADAKMQADKAKEGQALNKTTPQSQTTPLPTVEDAALYKAPMHHQQQQQQYSQANGAHQQQQAPTPQQQAATPQQQQQMQMQHQQQSNQSAMQQPGIIDVPQFSPNLDFSFGDLADFTQFGIENMSTNLNTNAVSSFLLLIPPILPSSNGLPFSQLLGDDGAINFDDFLVSGWQSTS